MEVGADMVAVAVEPVLPDPLRRQEKRATGVLGQHPLFLAHQ
jgi:hypothetical protein